MALTHVLTDSILQQRHLMALTHVLTDSILWQRHLMALTHVLTYIILQQRYLMALTHVLTYNILRQRHVMALTCVLTDSILQQRLLMALTHVLTDSILQQRLLMALTHFKVYCIIEINQSLSDVISCTLIDCCTRSWYNSRWLDVLRHRVLLETFIKKTSILMISDDQKKFIPISENMYQCLLNYNCIFVVVVSTITWTYVINLCVVPDQYLHTHFDFVDYYMYNVCILSEIIKFASTSFWNRKKSEPLESFFILFLHRVQIKSIFTDNIRILSFSWNIKKSKNNWWILLTREEELSLPAYIVIVVYRTL
jgi:hypothetical protein